MNIDEKRLVNYTARKVFLNSYNNESIDNNQDLLSKFVGCYNGS